MIKLNKLLIIILPLLSLLIGFIFVELTVQFYLDPKSGTNLTFKGIVERADKKNLTISQYAEDQGFARIFGAENALSNVINKENEIKHLIIGDSVTGGHGMTKGNSYAEIIGLENFSVSTHIWHINGGGIDQMLLKTISEAQFLNYSNVTIAFIAHDVIRSGTRFLYSSTKVKFQFGQNDKTKIILADDLGDFYNSYANAKKRFYLSFWYLKKYYDSKEYFFPNFFPKYYKKLFNHVATELEHLSKKNNLKINLVMLPNSYEFKGLEVINESFKEILNNQYSNISVYDLNHCAKKESDIYGVSFNKEFNFHPDYIGHNIIADCFKKLGINL